MIEARVSAIITAYNSAAFIADATRHVVAELADQGIKYIQQPHRGAGAARNKGIRETSGEFIAFLDADDIWLENKTRIRLEYLAAHPQAALVSGFAHLRHDKFSAVIRSIIGDGIYRAKKTFRTRLQAGGQR